MLVFRVAFYLFLAYFSYDLCAMNENCQNVSEESSDKDEQSLSSLCSSVSSERSFEDVFGFFDISDEDGFCNSFINICMDSQQKSKQKQELQSSSSMLSLNVVMGDQESNSALTGQLTAPSNSPANLVSTSPVEESQLISSSCFIVDSPVQIRRTVKVSKKYNELIRHYDRVKLDPLHIASITPQSVAGVPSTFVSDRDFSTSLKRKTLDDAEIVDKDINSVALFVGDASHSLSVKKTKNL